ncbi:MAG: methyltransferase domain-containing protein [Phycisphaerae bacterium]
MSTSQPTITDTQAASILDVRLDRDFLLGHHPDAANIPLEELAGRVHELPRRHVEFAVFDDDPIRARWAQSRLRARGYARVTLSDGGDRNHRVVGSARVRMWRPHALLREALGVIAESRGASGRDALDVACGAGRDAVFLATQGWCVEAWDILPDALERANDLARRNLAAITTRCVDLEGHSDWPRERYYLVMVFNYLYRPVFPRIQAAVRPGGWAVYETFVEPQRERYGRPRREAFVLQRGELRGFFDGWRILRYDESESHPRRIAAGIIAQKPVAGSRLRQAEHRA